MKLTIFSDGSGTHEYGGPACIGVTVFADGLPCVEASEYVGAGTNNVAELRAIRRGLWLAEQLVGFDGDIEVVSDSDYALGVIANEGYHLRANFEVIAAIRKQAKKFTRLRWRHVKGHGDCWGNVRADWLAGLARRRHLAAQGIKRPKKREPWPPPADRHVGDYEHSKGA